MQEVVCDFKQSGYVTMLSSVWSFCFKGWLMDCVMASSYTSGVRLHTAWKRCPSTFVNACDPHSGCAISRQKLMVQSKQNPKTINSEQWEYKEIQTGVLDSRGLRKHGLSKKKNVRNRHWSIKEETLGNKYLTPD